MNNDSASINASFDHYYWLDLLRFLAAFAVLIAHARGASIVEYVNLSAGNKTTLVVIGYVLTRLGNEAVILFLVLSGFLVGGKAIERCSRKIFRPFDYAVDRFARIMLPLIPALVLTGFVRCFIDGGFSLSQFACNVISLQGIICRQFGDNQPLWSLPYEVWCYIFVLSIGVLSAQLRLIAVVAMIATLMVFAYLDAEYIVCWFIGVAAYLYRPTLPRVRWIIASFVFIASGVVLIEAGTSPTGSHLSPSILPASRVYLAAGFSLLIQQLALTPPRGAIAVSIHDAGLQLCKWSYTLYLVHFPVLELLNSMGLQRSDHVGGVFFYTFSIRIIAAILVSLVMYWLFERNTAALKTFLKNREISLAMRGPT